jgi:NAD(P)-dependent dehydrogenase (short-subunit alcohol dehydrogenase family)
MQINHAIALVSGANRGLGRCFVETLLAGGAAKVYAAARDPATLQFDDPRVVPVQLDVTQPDQVAAAAALASDITLLINNAGINRLNRLFDAADPMAAREEMEVNYFGTLSMCRAFAPLLIQHAGKGAAIMNVLSILSRVALPPMGSLCASKAAALRMTEAFRAELAPHAVRVLGILPGAIDTDMSRDHPPPKLAVAEVVDAALAALEGGPDEVYVGEMAQGVAAGLAHDRRAVQAQFASYL